MVYSIDYKADNVVAWRAWHMTQKGTARPARPAQQVVKLHSFDAALKARVALVLAQPAGRQRLECGARGRLCGRPHRGRGVRVQDLGGSSTATRMLDLIPLMKLCRALQPALDSALTCTFIFFQLSLKGQRSLRFGSAAACMPERGKIMECACSLRAPLDGFVNKHEV